nr:carboxylic acid reductase [Mycolicibacterium arabiense]
MSQEDRLRHRVDRLLACDLEFAAARPDDAVQQELLRPDVRLFDVVRTVAHRYASRPALAQRATRLTTDGSGNTVAELRPSFATISYRELWRRVEAMISSLTSGPAPLNPGDRVVILGFSGIDYTVIDLAATLAGALVVPLQSGVATEQLSALADETQPVLIFTDVDLIEKAVDLALVAHAPPRIIAFGYDERVSAHRESLDAARVRASGERCDLVVEPLGDFSARGSRFRAPNRPDGDLDAPALLIYSSGSTGTPKGATISERAVVGFWKSLSSGAFGDAARYPAISLCALPLSHAAGRISVAMALWSGGTAYFTTNGDRPALMDDIALVRPTHLHLVPRMWEIVHHEVQIVVERLLAEGGGAHTSSSDIRSTIEEQLCESMIGGRQILAVVTGAPISTELKHWVQSFLDVPLIDLYGSTEAGMISINGRIVRPPVTEYRLADVPDLGYYSTDEPHPRGELLIKSGGLFGGYYRRPDVTSSVIDADGWYHTGDIVAQIGPDHVAYVDRTSNVLKLSQGEFVAAATLEGAYVSHPMIGQIYVYGSSTRSYLLAVIVPTAIALARSKGDRSLLRSLLTEALRETARHNALRAYEVPGDFLIEELPFALANGLLTGPGKPARAALKRRYGKVLEELYAANDESLGQRRRALAENRDSKSTRETVRDAALVVTGSPEADLPADSRFADIGGDSLSAVTFRNALRDLFGVEIPVSEILSPVTDLSVIADRVDAHRRSDSVRPTFASVHGANAREVRARDLALDAFIDAPTLHAGPSLPVTLTGSTVLLTGATGFLGRHVALRYLETAGWPVAKLICLIRGRDDADAAARLDRSFEGGDPFVYGRYLTLADTRLEVVAGDMTEFRLGLDDRTWQRLAATVDVIVDTAALVNHVLPYDELFDVNVGGAAELIRLAMTTMRKPIKYVSTIAVGDQISPPEFTECADVRAMSPIRRVGDEYANGYANSKWAAEVLLRQAHERCGIPVTVFRCDMILADVGLVGGLNLPDMFTRFVFSVLATGMAPDSFYTSLADGQNAAHYDALPVTFVAEAITGLAAASDPSAHVTYHVANPHSDGIGMDTFVDWLIEDGHAITRVGPYAEWLRRFETALRALPDEQRRLSLLPLLHDYRRPRRPDEGSAVPVDRFRAAVGHAGLGERGEIPHIQPSSVRLYAAELKRIGLL